MEEHQLNTLAAPHLLQHTLRSLCNSQWVYAVFWRMLPRNYPPSIWDDGNGGNIRNWILAWEDGFCNGIQPEIFFKMSHEIYNYGEGFDNFLMIFFTEMAHRLVGKVAAHRTHKWVFHDSSGETIPRAWETQFQSGIKTIALVAVREGVVQLGAVNWAREDINHVVSVRSKIGLIESIPGALFPHPRVVPSMTSLDALLSRLPPVTPTAQHNNGVVFGSHCQMRNTEVEE